MKLPGDSITERYTVAESRDNSDANRLEDRFSLHLVGSLRNWHVVLLEWVLNWLKWSDTQWRSYGSDSRILICEYARMYACMYANFERMQATYQLVGKLEREVKRRVEFKIFVKLTLE